jgi:hypothetical protein
VSNIRFLRARGWLDDDGKHVWQSHECVTGRVTSMLPWPIWKARRDDPRYCDPSVSCSACGLHTFLLIERDGEAQAADLARDEAAALPGSVKP